MDLQHLLLGLATAFYSGSLLYSIWRLAMGRSYRHWPKFAILLPGFILHTAALMVHGLAEGRCPVSTPFETLSFTAWSLVAFQLLLSITLRLSYLTPFSMPWVLVLQVAAFILPRDSSRAESFSKTLWLGIHVPVTMFGYAAFGLASAVGVMYLIQEKQLRTHRLSNQFMLLPPILRLEALQGRLLVGGFALLTIGLVTGFIGIRGVREGFYHPNAKVLWSLVVWFFYMVLILGKNHMDINGRRLAWMSVGMGLFVMGAFWLSRLFF